MRLLLLLPLTYIAGIDGFGWFVPYLMLVGLVAAVLRRAGTVRLSTIRAAETLDLSELEPTVA